MVNVPTRQTNDDTCWLNLGARRAWSRWNR